MHPMLLTRMHILLFGISGTFVTKAYTILFQIWEGGVCVCNKNTHYLMEWSGTQDNIRVNQIAGQWSINYNMVLKSC